MANKIVLRIAGITLTVSSNENEQHLLELSDTLSEDIEKLKSFNSSTSVITAALICALDYLSRYEKEYQSCANLREQIKNYMNDASRAKLELDEATRKYKDMSEEMLSLRERLSQLSFSSVGVGDAEELRKQLSSIQEDCALLRRQLNEQLEQNKTLNATINAQSVTISSKNAELDKYSELLKQQSEQLESLHDTSEDYGFISKRVAQLEAQLEQSRNEYEAIKSDRDSISLQLASSDSERTELESMLNDAYRDTDILKQQVAYFTSEDEVPSTSETVDNNDEPIDPSFSDFIASALSTETEKSDASADDLLSEESVKQDEDIAERLASSPTFSSLTAGYKSNSSKKKNTIIDTPILSTPAPVNLADSNRDGAEEEDDGLHTSWIDDILKDDIF